MIKVGNPKRLVMAGVTLGCALAIGYVMQMSAGPDPAVPENGAGSLDTEAFASAFIDETVTPAEAEVPVDDKIADIALQDGTVPAPVDPEKEALFDAASAVSEQSSDTSDLGFDQVTLTSAEPVVPDLPSAAPQPRALPLTPLQLAALGDTPIGELPREEAAPALSCEIEMTATPVAAAMVELDLSAPCLAERQFTLHHNGMMFSALTDADGAWKMQVPALARTGVFIAAFDNGEGAVANAKVDTLDYYDRFVVQWKGARGMQLHALEYGAAYGEAGHVWNGSARDAASAANGEGGFLLRLGEGILEDTVLRAEVYTFPTQNALREGTVEVSLEAEVNAANCGRDVEAQALIKPGAGEINARDLTLAIPDCAAVGDFLVLKNLYEDLKIARN